MAVFIGMCCSLAPDTVADGRVLHGEEFMRDIEVHELDYTEPDDHEPLDDSARQRKLRLIALITVGAIILSSLAGVFSMVLQDRDDPQQETPRGTVRALVVDASLPAEAV